jgi:hypothetical protein
MNKLVLALGVLAAAVGISALATPGSGRADQGGNSYSIGLSGDVPYSVHQQTIGVPNLIADMNSSHLAFTIHDGDLKQGSGSPCDDALYVRSEGYLNSLVSPAMYTPGDNEWTDCAAHRTAASTRWRGSITSAPRCSTRPTRSASIRCCRPFRPLRTWRTDAGNSAQ